MRARRSTRRASPSGDRLVASTLTCGHAVEQASHRVGGRVGDVLTVVDEHQGRFLGRRGEQHVEAREPEPVGDHTGHGIGSLDAAELDHIRLRPRTPSLGRAGAAPSSAAAVAPVPRRGATRARAVLPIPPAPTMVTNRRPEASRPSISSRSRSRPISCTRANCTGAVLVMCRAAGPDTRSHPLVSESLYRPIAGRPATDGPSVSVLVKTGLQDQAFAPVRFAAQLAVRRIWNSRIPWSSTETTIWDSGTSTS